jgi:TatD DNase family protein
MKPYINIHTHVIDNDTNNYTILNVYPEECIPKKSFFSTGIHPWRINENWKNELKVIANNLLITNCLALGECGLDKRIETPITKQIEIFEAQIKLASELKKPIIIHCVAAFDEILEILKQHSFKEKVIFHGFSKSKELAQQLYKLGYYISFGKYLIQNENLSEVFVNTPQDFYFLETDNSQYTINQIYKKASEINQLSVEKIQEIVYANFKKVFKLNYQ